MKRIFVQKFCRFGQLKHGRQFGFLELEKNTKFQKKIYKLKKESQIAYLKEKETSTNIKYLVEVVIFEIDAVTVGI